MALLYIALSVGCSLGLAQFLKIAENKELNVLRVLTYNYLTAFLISFFGAPEFFHLGEAFHRLDTWIIASIVLLGIIFIANLMVYSRSIHKIGMGVSMAAMRMSLIFPIAVSLFVFGENIAAVRYGGIFLAFVSLFLLIPKIKKEDFYGISEAWLPLLIFIMTGLADTGMKVFERVFSAHMSEGLFLAGIFIVSFAVGLSVLVYRKEIHFSLTEIAYGSLAGIVNLYASVFLIYALQLMPGSLVFPLINVSIVVFGTWIGIWFWKDHPTKLQWTGLFIAIISIVLLLV